MFDINFLDLIAGSFREIQKDVLSVQSYRAMSRYLENNAAACTIALLGRVLSGIRLNILLQDNS